MGSTTNRPHEINTYCQAIFTPIPIYTLPVRGWCVRWRLFRQSTRANMSHLMLAANFIALVNISKLTKLKNFCRHVSPLKPSICHKLARIICDNVWTYYKHTWPRQADWWNLCVSHARDFTEVCLFFWMIPRVLACLDIFFGDVCECICLC